LAIQRFACFFGAKRRSVGGDRGGGGGSLLVSAWRRVVSSETKRFSTLSLSIQDYKLALASC